MPAAIAFKPAPSSAAAVGACANTGIADNTTATTTKKSLLSFLICYLLLNQVQSKSELRSWPEACIISPASGIHRPSYNGAPARQTFGFTKRSDDPRPECSSLVHQWNDYAPTCAGSIAGIARRMPFITPKLIGHHSQS